MVFVVILNGPACAGKTTIAEALWKDLKRTAILNLDEFKWLIYDHESTEFDLNLASKVGLEAMKTYLDHGVSVIVEKAFCEQKYVEAFIKYAEKNSIKILVFNIEAPLDICEERCECRVVRHRGNLQPFGKERVPEIYDYYSEGKFNVDRTFDTSKLSVEEIVDEIKKMLKA